jgi:hypothetical protein
MEPKEKAVVKLLKTIYRFKAERGRWPYTRELLKAAKTEGYSHKALKRAKELGLVERTKTNCGAKRPCIANALTPKGLEMLKLWGEDVGGEAE